MGKLFFLITLLLSFSAFGEEVNILKNPDFEARTSRWSKTGSSTFSMESASPLIGDYSGGLLPQRSVDPKDR